MKKLLLIVLAVIAVVVQFAGADVLAALGLSENLADLLISGCATAVIFPITVEQTAIVIAFKNSEMIADRAMPIKKLRSGSLSFKWFLRDLADGFTIPSTLVGRASRPNSVSFNGTEQSGLCAAYGLESPVTQEDIDQAGDSVGPLVSDRLQALINMVLLDRERRVASIVENTANYLSSQVTATAAGDKFGADGSNPLKYVLGKLDAAIVRPNKIGMNQTAWTTFRTNPEVVKAVHGNAGNSGVATRQQVAELLEVKEILVGSAMVNTAKRGQTAVLSRCWGNHLWAHYEEPLADAQDGLAWGATMQSGDRYAHTVEDPHLGLKGGFWCKAGAYQSDVVMAPGAGILLTNVI